MRPRYPGHGKSRAERELLVSLTQGSAFYNAFEKDIAVVNIFFASSTVFAFERSKRMTWLDFISNLGGVCGLCLGISFISITELVYLFTLRLFKRVLCTAY